MAEGTSMTVLDPLELVVATSIIIFLIMLAWSLATEGLVPWSGYLKGPVYGLPGYRIRARVTGLPGYRTRAALNHGQKGPVYRVRTSP